MKLADIPEFKETEIGPIPVDWSVAHVATLANVDSESLSNKTAAEFSFRYISLGDVDAGKLIGGHRPITFAEAPSRARRVVKSGDILFATVRPNLKGHFLARCIDGNVIASTGFAVIRARDGIAVPAFIYQALLSGNVDAQIEKLTVGSNYPAVNSADVKGLLLPAPPLPEQQKIAAILTSVDDKLDVIARQIDATQNLKQGLMQTLFSRGVGTEVANGRWVSHAEFKDSELGEIPAAWEVKPLDALAHSITVGIATSTTEHYVQDGIPLIRNQNIKEDFLDMSDLLQISAEFNAKNKSKQVEGGDILTVRTGYPGVSCVVPNGLGRLQTFTTLITRPIRQLVDPHFVSRYFNSPQGKGLMLHQAAGGAQQNMNAGNLKKLLVPVPPLSEQKQIAAVLAAIDEKRRSLFSRMEHLQNLKRGLMQKLLTGEWRVSLNDSATGT